jgi:micrococcal nuclease
LGCQVPGGNPHKHEFINGSCECGELHDCEFYQGKCECGKVQQSGGTEQPGDEIKTPYTDKLKLTASYAGKNFINDGIGEVTLFRSIDGDTAHFYCGNEVVKVRFLGVDTPESTIQKEAWGKAASDFTASILRNAETIVLENIELSKDVYDRYLAYVWADGVLVNLQLVEEAYSDPKIGLDSPYFEYFMQAGVEAKKTGRRVYGEIDPNYDYENKRFK